MAVCAEHPGVEALAACRRCGRYCCAACLPRLELCAGCTGHRQQEALGELRRGLTPLLVALLAEVVLSVCFAIGFALDRLVRPAALLELPLFLLTLGLLLPWSVRATAAAAHAGQPLEGHSPREAAVLMFLPYRGGGLASLILSEVLAVGGRQARLAPLWPVSWLLAVATHAAGADRLGLVMRFSATALAALIALINLAPLRERAAVSDGARGPAS